MSLFNETNIFTKIFLVKFDSDVVFEL